MRGSDARRARQIGHCEGGGCATQEARGARGGETRGGASFWEGLTLGELSNFQLMAERLRGPVALELSTSFNGQILEKLPPLFV